MRSLLESTLKDVWDEIRTQTVRVGLSLMAIAIGIASLIVLIAVLGGLQKKSDQIIKEFGVHVMGIFRHNEVGQPAAFTLQERHAKLLADTLTQYPVSTTRRYEVSTLGTLMHLSVVATDSFLAQIRQWPLTSGRFLDHHDIKNRERSAVVSKTLSELWNWEVGNVIMLKDVPFNIVGIIELGGSALDTELADSKLILGERVVFVPKTVPPNWVTNMENIDDVVDAIFIRAPSSESFDRALSVAQRLLSQPDYNVKNVSWVTPHSLTQGVNKLQKTIKLTVGSIALLSLILGGTTLMSLMVTNVHGRVTEIGLRRAMGATQQEIAILFVVEACLITGVAAAAATLSIHIVLSLARDLFPVPIELGLKSILIPFLVAIILGMVLSYWPAKFAAGITPSEALRNE